ncbi:hypothetical protein [Herbidospora daliensis]|uniref:hypothetical protein n=1 Tax=Herbidospora daliensis TaxID=295585 RepID=UPI000783280A|nr:hypothetical protein [Herbidospora daliensis]
MTARLLAPAAHTSAAGTATRDQLLQLARDHADGNLYEIHKTVDHLAGAGRTEAQTWALFEDLVRAVEQRDLLDAGLLHWTEIEPDLAGPDPSDAAADIARGRVTDALNALLKTTDRRTNP